MEECKHKFAKNVILLVDFLQSSEEKVTPLEHKSLHQNEMFRISLVYACRQNHPLVKLVEKIPWEIFEDHFGKQYCPDDGHTDLPIQMVVGLLLVKNSRGLSDYTVNRVVFGKSVCAVFLRGAAFSARVATGCE